MSKIRVALLTYAIDNRPAKGTAIVARKTVEALLRRPDEFELTFLHYEKTDDPIYRHGVKEVLFPTFRWSWLNRRFLRQIYYFITTPDRFDVIQWFQSRLYPFFWLAPARRILVTIHGAGDITAPHIFNLSRTIFNWTLRLGRRWIDRGIAVSEYARTEIQSAYHLRSEQVVVIPNGVDDTFFLPRTDEEKERIRHTYGLPNRFLLNLGRHIPHKNVVRVIDAFELAVQQGLSPEVHLVQVGTGGSESARIEQKMKQSPMKDRLHHHVFMEEKDLPVLYQLAEALVLPSLNEGQGMPVLEAMASGIPVVTSNTTSLKEIGTGAALLVDPLQVTEIAQAMRAITTDQSLRAQLVEAGRARAAQFSWKEADESLYRLYRELVQL